MPNNWLYIALIPAMAWVGVTARRASTVLAAVGVAILVTTIAYRLPLPGNRAAQEPFYAGQVLAEVLASLLPFAGAGFAGRLRPVLSQSRQIRIVLSIGVGLTMLLPRAYLQLGLGCAFTAICP